MSLEYHVIARTPKFFQQLLDDKLSYVELGILSRNEFCYVLWYFVYIFLLFKVNKDQSFRFKILIKTS